MFMRGIFLLLLLFSVRLLPGDVDGLNAGNFRIYLLHLLFSHEQGAALIVGSMDTSALEDGFKLLGRSGDQFLLGR